LLALVCGRECNACLLKLYVLQMKKAVAGMACGEVVGTEIAIKVLGCDYGAGCDGYRVLASWQLEN